MLYRFTFLLALAAAAGPAFAQPGPSGPPAVGVAQAQKRPIIETSEFVGRIQAVNRQGLRMRSSELNQAV